MSVLIKGMEMPKTCEECALNYDSYACIKTGSRFFGDRETEFDPFKGRLEDCPLVPVPPHGRLIDADAFFDDLLFPSKQFEQGMRELIGDAPTVIEAEETLKEAADDQNNS